MKKGPDIAAIHDMMIMDYVIMERERCAALVKALHNEKDFLLYCIAETVYFDQIGNFRKRFTETTVDVEDLM